MEEIAKEGLLNIEGENWRRHRKIISSVFHYEFLKQMTPVVIQTANEFLDKLAQKDDLKNQNIMNEMQKITGEIVARIFFGNSLTSNLENDKPITTELGEIISESFMTTFGFWNVVVGQKFVRRGILPQHKRLMTRLKKFQVSL